METETDDKTGQKVTERQRRAIDVLLSGGSVRAAAEAAGVSRQTASGWLHHDRFFRDTLNRESDELHAAARERARAMAGKALDVIAGALDDGDRRVAIDVLKGVGLFAAGHAGHRTGGAHRDGRDRPEGQVVVYLPDNGRTKK